MKSQLRIRIASGIVVTLGLGFVLAGTFRNTTRVQAQGYQQEDESSLIKKGFEIAPVPLDLDRRDRDLVGLGSFLVNGVADCNGCHTGGGPPNFNYAAGHNPYFGQPTKPDPTTYLEGGSDFGQALPPGFYAAGYGDYVGPDIISRNLTPDKTGRPEGGHTLAEFKQIMRTGIDLDHIHPPCTDVSPTPSPANCIPSPVDGNLLQVMPWPVFHNMTDHQLDAIYEYLSSIPCLEGSTDPNSNLYNDCGDDHDHDKDGRKTSWQRK
jgi:hypothetical protein